MRRIAASSAIAVAGPYLAPASTLGAGENTAANGRIRMGFIGVGAQGFAHLTGGGYTYLPGGYLARRDVQVVAVCDVWKDRRERARQTVNEHYARLQRKGSYNGCAAYVDFRDLLDRPDIDAVLIATPAHWHATMASLAAEAGKDIYCEQPTAVTVRESQAMLNAVRRYERVYQAGTQQRSEYGGRFRLACELVRSGRLGKLKEIYSYRDGGGLTWRASFGSGRPVPDGLDWDLYLGPAPEFPYDGNTGPDRFALGELRWGQHHHDIVQWASGADQTGPVEFFMQQNRSCYRYASGVVVYGKPFPNEPVGLQGGACFVGANGRIAVDRNALVSDPPDLVKEPLLPGDVHLYSSGSHSGNFLDCVRTRQRPICDAPTAHRSASVLVLGGIARQLQRRLGWDPQIERFTDDDAANRLLSRAKRAPWC